MNATAVTRRVPPPWALPCVAALCCCAALPGVAAAGPRAAARQIPFDRTCHGHLDGVMCVAFLPDSKRVVSGSYDRTLKLWDVAHARVLRTFEGHAGPVYAVSVSSNGALVASGSGDGTVKVWEVETGDQVGQLEGHTGAVRGVKFLPDGRLLTGGEDGLRLWDVSREKLLWKPDPRADNAVHDLAISGDGRRAAVFTRWAGPLQVWDVQTGAKRASLGGAGRGHLGTGVHISHDGSRVYGRVGEREYDFGGWEVATGRRLALPVELFNLDFMHPSPDGRRLVLNGPSGLSVWDPESWRRVHSLSHTHRDVLTCAAVSRDGRTVVVGSGGMEAGDGWMRGQDNVLYVYTLPPPDAQPPAGPPEGGLSWEVIPATVKTLAGASAPLAHMAWPAADHATDNEEPRARALAPGIDALWQKSVVLLHREKGVLHEVLADGDAGYSDVVWDGQAAWVASRKKGVAVLDRDGKVLASAGGADGLPASEHVMLLHPLGPGRVLAAGAVVGSKATPGGGWCAVLERQAGAARLKVDVFLKEPKLPPGWNEDEPDGPDARGLFRPAWVAEVPSPEARAAGARYSVWIGCEATTSVPNPVLRVDPQSLAVSAYELEPAAGPGNHVVTGGFPPYFPSEQVMLRYDGATRRVPLGASSADLSGATLVCDAVTSLARPPYAPFREPLPLLPHGGAVYVPGPRWRRVDPKTFDAEDMGPGLRVDGRVVDDRLTYFVSAHWGLAAVSRLDGCLYRFSDDPARPAPVRATAEPVRPPPVEESGVVEVGPFGRKLFRCGEGVIHFDNGRAGGARSQPRGWDVGPTAREVGAAEASHIATRVRVDASEQQRVGATQRQVERLAALKAPGPPRFDAPEQKRLDGLFAEYERAAAAPEKQRAERALLDAARELGAKLAKADETYAAEVRAVFSPRQWKLLHYQKPGPADADAIPAAFIGPPAGAADDRRDRSSADDDEAAEAGHDKVPNPLSRPLQVGGLLVMTAALGVYIWRRRAAR